MRIVLCLFFIGCLLGLIQSLPEQSQNCQKSTEILSNELSRTNDNLSERNLIQIVASVPALTVSSVLFSGSCLDSAQNSASVDFLKGGSIKNCLTDLEDALKSLQELDTEIEKDETFATIEYAFFLGRAALASYFECKKLSPGQIGSYLYGLLPLSGQNCIDYLGKEKKDIRDVVADLESKESFFMDLAAVVQAFLDGKNATESCEEFLNEAFDLNLRNEVKRTFQSIDEISQLAASASRLLNEGNNGLREAPPQVTQCFNEYAMALRGVGECWTDYTLPDFQKLFGDLLSTKSLILEAYESCKALTKTDLIEAVEDFLGPEGMNCVQMAQYALEDAESVIQSIEAGDIQEASKELYSLVEDSQNALKVCEAFIKQKEGIEE